MDVIYYFIAWLAGLISEIQGNTLLIFGLCLVCGVAGGMVANRISWMPTITAFMLLGLAIGPSGLHLISKPMLAEASIFIDIALGLIIYKLGTMLHPYAMIHSRRLMTIAIAEGILSYVLVFAAARFLGLESLVAAIIAAISVSSSPAVLVHVAEEMRAKGPVSYRAKSLVAVNNLLAFLLFSLALPFSMAGENVSALMMVGLPLYRLAGAVIVGIVVAWLAIQVVRRLQPQDEHFRFAIVIGAVMVTLGLCTMFNASALFSPLVLGIALRWFETSKHKLSQVPLGEGGDLFFIVLFVLAGAKIDLGNLVEVGIIPVILVLMRCIGKTAGIYGAGAMHGIEKTHSAATSMMLTPMAGMAIGLVATTSLFAPHAGTVIATIVFAMVAILETIGPFLVTHALRLCGEAGKLDPDTDEWQEASGT